MDKTSLKLTRNDAYLISGVFGFLLGLLLFIFFTPNYYYVKAPYEFEVKTGWSFRTVADSLYVRRIIPNKTMFRIAAFFYSAESRIKAGKYSLPNGLNYFDLIEMLIHGSDSHQELITIPEGIWQHNLAGLFQEKFDIDSARFMKLSKDRSFLSRIGVNSSTAEGYLLPDTYYFYEDAKEEEIIAKLKGEMDKLFLPDSIQQQMKLLGMNQHQILTLASIIEGESNIVSEFKKISGVYHNRLGKSIALQADPTIQYLKRYSRRKNKIYYRDLDRDSPYNTYKYRGLPPTPINNPGKDAVMAALFPEKHDYYYFVADGSGGHVFAKSLSEHNKNVRNYRRWRNSQN
ncbi:MAG: endolytic transglycosylase MltG [Melioribacteraceae bacterium]|nr:endolytic transglycosylase MltG [Melioribacteraceae bacterium]